MIQWRDSHEKNKVKTESCGTDKVYANQRASEKRIELASGQTTGVRVISYDDFMTEHLEQIQGFLSQATHKEHRLVLQQLKEICNSRNLSVIDFGMIEKFRNCRINIKLSPATVNKGLRTLQLILEWAVDRNFLKVNPFKGKRRKLFLKEPEPTPKAFEPDEFQAMLDACLDARWRGICTIGYFAGLRQSEIFALEWDDIDFDNKVLHVRNKADHLTKNHKNRDIPMSKEIIDALNELKSGMFRSSYVFTSNELAGRKMKNNACRDFIAIVKRAGLIDAQNRHRFTMHNFRDTFITNLLVA